MTVSMRRQPKRASRCLVVAVLVLLIGSATAAPKKTKSELEKPKSGQVLITPKVIDSPVDDIKWVGAKSETVFVKTKSGSLYRSDDFGRAWVPLLSVLQATGSLVSGHDEVGVVSKLVVSPGEQDLIVAIGTKNHHWISNDRGKSWRALNEGRALHEIMIHPLQSRWALASSWTPDCTNESEEGYCVKELYMTKNLAEKKPLWEKISDYVVQFSWAKQVDNPFWDAPEIPVERIIVSRFSDAEGKQKVGGWHQDVDTVFSDDFFKSAPRLLMPRGNKFLFSNNFMFVAQVDAKKKTEVHLMVSNDLGRTFKEAMLPFKLSQHSYTILDTSEGSVFLHVNHYGPNVNYGIIYTSDATGTRFTLSLDHNVRNADGQCDFDKVLGLEGIYIANYIEEVDVEDEDDNNRGIKNDHGGNKRKGSGARRQNTRKSKHQYIRTVVSFDKGGNWRYLAAPEKDADGKTIACPQEECSLNLHGITFQQFGPFYSTENAVGVVMGTGNVGDYLRSRTDEVNTYFSRDGGLTWHEIRKGSYIYEIGDHGGLIVMADDQKATKEILFTWNEGLTWEIFEFYNKEIEVENIVIEPNATAQQFLVYGTLEGKGVIVQLDFSKIHDRDCEGADAPGEDSDFELWSPSGASLSGRKCLMGRQVSYTRRKQQSACFNGQEYERRELVKNCDCTEEDYECDYGYERRKLNVDNKAKVGELGPCVAIKGMENNITNAANCPIGEMFEVTGGYRKVPGDSCVNDLHTSYTVPCGGGVGHAGWMVLFVLLAIVVLLGGITYASRSAKFKHLFGNIGFGGGSAKYAPIGRAGVDTAVEEDYDEEEEGEAELLRDNVIMGYTQAQNRDTTVTRRGIESASKPVNAIKPPPGGHRSNSYDDDEDDFDPRV
eukprot:GILK01002514.1.p1 GENE.GILK01002514.1~~GILK01002514.1.p1  ORF type:complete len:898 (+),score=135.65 GILK01002514.1:39-2696(+)